MNAFGEFGEPLQHIINAYAYGDVWSRPGLSLGVKSLAMIAMMAAANRPAELRVHLKGALKNGCTPEEIREVLLLVALYCGIPGRQRGPPRRDGRAGGGEEDLARLGPWAAYRRADRIAMRAIFNAPKREVEMAKKQKSGGVYRIVDVVGVSKTSWEDAGTPRGGNRGQLASRSARRRGHQDGHDGGERQSLRVPHPRRTVVQIRELSRS